MRLAFNSGGFQRLLSNLAHGEVCVFTSSFCRGAAGVLMTTRRFHASTRGDLTDDEMALLSKELPPRELLRRAREGPTSSDSSKGPGTVEDELIGRVPGDAFGIFHNRTVFLRPVPRPQLDDPSVYVPVGSPVEDMDPRWRVNPVLMRRLCTMQGWRQEKVASLFRQCDGELNEMHRAAAASSASTADAHPDNERGERSTSPFGTYSLVALESYAPECFCAISVTLPSYAACRDEETLEAIHELVLSAAELPMDLDKKALLQKFHDEWTVESGETCSDVMASFGLKVTDILLLAHGEYGATGFHVLHPLTDLGFPNIGSAASGVCMDLRTGIHNRFRFHVERMADAISEHLLREQLHVGQDDVHMLRQAYWFNSEYSVEEYIRFKENLLQPSATLFELRYVSMFASNYGLPSFRNVVEMEKLKVAQHKHEKHYEDFTAPGQFLTSDKSQLQSVAAGGGGSNLAGVAVHRETNTSTELAMPVRVSGLTNTLRDSIQRHGDRVFQRFYRNNYF